MKTDTKTMPNARQFAKIALVLAGAAVAGALCGCSTLGAKAWDRDLMARRSMQPVTHPLVAGADDHIYFSKEGASGGRTFDGGGCGCN